MPTGLFIQIKSVIIPNDFKSLQSMIIIELASQNKMSQDDINKAYSLLSIAYAETEKEIWGENYSRLRLDEFIDLIDAEEVFFAKIKDEIVGSIHTSRLDDESFGFGLLSADFDRKGLGIGRKLIKTAEIHAKSQGAKYMKIEILRPSNVELPQKKQLDEWYRRQGYEFINSMSFVDRKPDKAEKALKLITPTQFDCYQKVL